MTIQTQLWLAESPIDVVEGSTLVYNITWTGKSAGASPAAKIYHNNQDVTATYMTGASTISNGTPPVQVLPSISGLVGGEEYVVVISAVVDGNTEVHKLLIRCVKAGDSQ
jgi:hypothetical protein